MLYSHDLERNTNPYIHRLGHTKWLATAVGHIGGKRLHSDLDVLLEVLPGDGVRDALVDVVERLLEYPRGHVLLLLVLVQHLEQHLLTNIKAIGCSPQSNDRHCCRGKSG